jgi:hypothetical protein
MLHKPFYYNKSSKPPYGFTVSKTTISETIAIVNTSTKHYNLTAFMSAPKSKLIRQKYGISLGGKTFQNIAGEFGVSRQLVHHALRNTDMLKRRLTLDDLIGVVLQLKEQYPDYEINFSMKLKEPERRSTQNTATSHDVIHRNN